MHQGISQGKFMTKYAGNNEVIQFLDDIPASFTISKAIIDLPHIGLSRS